MQEEVYHSNYKTENTYFWFLSRNAIVYNTFQSICNPDNEISGSNLIDIGCGTGGFSSILQTNGFNMTGLDMEAIALDYCRKRGLTNLYNCYVHQVKDILPDTNFKAAFALDVIEHIEDDNKAVSDIYDLLPHGSYFIATVPAYQWLWSNHDVIHMHYRRYTLKNFENLLKTNKFHIKYSSYFNTLLFPAVVGKRFLDKLLKKENNSPVDEVSDSLNKILKLIFDQEKKLIPNVKLPFGLSIIVVAQKF